jgi:hypothetical protein
LAEAKRALARILEVPCEAHGSPVGEKCFEEVPYVCEFRGVLELRTRRAREAATTTDRSNLRQATVKAAQVQTTQRRRRRHTRATATIHAAAQRAVAPSTTEPKEGEAP